ncbi:GET complex subunit get1 [Conoideocrella luteorostrata]|uniref:GET complex subunit get1 n=1 Tax=Conoideocrella luteorostrata TaxID=1105319 RepID=A0AAJ0FTU6_9HYPO|nr:GET complex subunit get1 [Conoideocrella luteorostrata]
MTKILFIIFAVEAVAQFINAVGATQINNLIWTLINFLPISTSKAAAEQRRIQADYLKIRRELNATSSQDEFAKWAKLRRQHDKLLEQLDAAKKGLEASRARFDNYLTAIRMLLTKVPQYVVPFWYGKEPMFWLPYGWFPYYAEWIISFPRAPLGSVSAPSWQLACSGVITLLSEIIIFIGKQIFAQPKIKVAVPAQKSAKKTAGSSEAPEAKKEL